jgi:hypothetical protein
MRVATATGMVVTALVVLAPSAASAAQRYASPTGSGAVCDAANPCGLTNAVSGATTGDEVIVAPGDYALTATLRQVNRAGASAEQHAPEQHRHHVRRQRMSDGYDGGTNTSSYRNVTAVSTDPLGYAIMARAIGGAAGRCAGHRRRRVR